VQLGDQRHEAKAGVWIFMPPEQLHAVQATEGLVFLLTLFKRF
jgi:quercetin dioxygenase-like cupin family protein